MDNNHVFKKKLGQNFLRSRHYLEKILETLKLEENDILVEVGPGDGALTNIILERYPEIKITSVEYDSSLYETLESRFDKYANWSLLKQDILQVDLNQFDATKIIGNLPYNISKKIIRNFLYSNIQQGYFLIQKEVAYDYTVSPPKASFLSNMVQCFGACTYEFQIPKEEFFPMPKVDGGLISINKYWENMDEENLERAEKLVRFIHSGFASPRKTLVNNLSYLDNIKQTIAKLDMNPLARAQEVSIDQWRLLYKDIYGS